MGCTVCGPSWLLGLQCLPLCCAACVWTHCDPADLGSQVSEIKGGCGSNREMLQNILILQRLPLWDTSHSYFRGCRVKECYIRSTVGDQYFPAYLLGSRRMDCLAGYHWGSERECVHLYFSVVWLMISHILRGTYGSCGTSTWSPQWWHLAQPASNKTINKPRSMCTHMQTWPDINPIFHSSWLLIVNLALTVSTDPYGHGTFNSWCCKQGTQTHTHTHT